MANQLQSSKIDRGRLKPDRMRMRGWFMVRRMFVGLVAALALLFGLVVVPAPVGAVGNAVSIVSSPGTASTNWGGESNSLNSVSCVSVSFCTAVGSYTNVGPGPRTLVQRWNGSAWSTATSANAGSTYTSNTLSSVSCVSTSFCIAVGYFNNGFYTGDYASRTLVERWNGQVWSIVASPNSGSGSNSLNSVSCVSASSCVAVGSYYSGAANRTLVLSWNGTSWTRVTSPNTGSGSNSLNSVSCVSVSFCTAVGWFSNNSGSEDRTLVERWNGLAWSTVTSPSPSPSSSHNFLRSVSCVSTSSCTAAAYYFNRFGA